MQNMFFFHLQRYVMSGKEMEKFYFESWKLFTVVRWQSRENVTITKLPVL